MRRRNYLQSVASIPALSLPSLLSLSTETEQETVCPYNIHSLWSRDEKKGDICGTSYSYQYENYDKWRSATVVHSSIQGIDLVPELTDIENIKLISVSDPIDFDTRIVLTSPDTDFDFSLSSNYMRELKIYYTDGTKKYIIVEDLAELKQKIKERV